MGADFFITKSTGKTAEQAFKQAVKDAKYEYGHKGYTGSMAEKDSFIRIDDLHPDFVTGWTHKAMNDERIIDKWGPAGCIDLGNGEYLFFGWASA